MKESKFLKTPENMQLACQVSIGLILERKTMTVDDDDVDIGQSHLFSDINNDSYEEYYLKLTGVFFLNRNVGEGTWTEMG